MPPLAAASSSSPNGQVRLRQKCLPDDAMCAEKPRTSVDDAPLAVELAVYEIDSLSDRVDVLRIFVGDLHAELVLEGHE